MNIFNLFTISRYIKPKIIIPSDWSFSLPNMVFLRKVNVELGKYIKRFRVKRGYLQQELAWIAGISNGHLSRIERGVKPLSDKMARKIGKALKINLLRKKKEKSTTK